MIKKVNIKPNYEASFFGSADFAKLSKKEIINILKNSEKNLYWAQAAAKNLSKKEIIAKLNGALKSYVDEHLAEIKKLIKQYTALNKDYAAETALYLKLLEEQKNSGAGITSGASGAEPVFIDNPEDSIKSAPSSPYFKDDITKTRERIYDIGNEILEIEKKLWLELSGLRKIKNYKEALPEEALGILESVTPAPDSSDIAGIHARGFTGKNITIVILDSGIDALHPAFKGRIKFFKDFIHDKQAPYDDEGHGTHVSGIAAGSITSGNAGGIAPDANLIVLKVLDENNNINTAALGKALKWINENKNKYGIRVINSSFSLNQYRWEAVKDDAGAIIRDGNIVWVAGAGNEGLGAGLNEYPRSLKEVISAGILNNMFSPSPSAAAVSPFSSWDGAETGKPDILAPGESILAPLGRKSKLSEKYKNYLITDGKADYVFDTGSSMSSAYVAGLAAVLLGANPGLTAAQIKEILLSTAKPFDNTPSFIQGKGAVNPLKALEKALNTAGAKR